MNKFKNFKIRSFIKWTTLALSLSLTAVLLLMFYQGGWGAGKWKDSSIDLTGTDGAFKEFLETKTVYGEGAGALRLKQLLIAFVGGGALAFAGCLLQKVTRNTLSEVSILGIGSINIMFIFGYVFIFKDKVFGSGIEAALLPIVTLGASILGTCLVWVVSRSKKANKNTFVIVGIASQLLFEALSVVFVNPTNLKGEEGKQIWSTIKNYTMGQIRTSADNNGIPWWLIITASVLIGLTITVGLFLRKKIDIYETSEESAQTLGVDVKKLRFGIFMMVAVLAGIEATILGTVALLGIIAPSISRLIFKNKFAPMAIGSFLIGGLLVMIASFISTNIGTDLPPGILTTVIASPYFIFLILRGK